MLQLQLSMLLQLKLSMLLQLHDLCKYVAIAAVNVAAVVNDTANVAAVAVISLLAVVNGAEVTVVNDVAMSLTWRVLAQW